MIKKTILLFQLFFCTLLLQFSPQKVLAATLYAEKAVTQALASGQPQTFIVEYESSSIQKQYQAATIQAQSNPLTLQAVIQQKSQAYTALKQQVNAGLPTGTIKTTKDYSHLPLSAVEVSNSTALAQLLAQPGVKAVYENKKHYMSRTESYALINQPAAIATGNTGAGTTVAVLDTGAYYTRASLGSCTSPGVPAGCRVVYAKDFAPDDGMLDDATDPHGSSVSEIIAGLATGTQLAVLDVFNGSFASTTDITAGLNWVLANKTKYNIVAVNMSLGTPVSHSTQCTSSAYASTFSNLLAAGIMPVVASGNNGFKSGISEPACAPGAISVGAVYDANVGTRSWATGCTDTTTNADQVTCFSNSVSYLSLLAPGSVVLDSTGSPFSGTSMAAPMVAGAIAVLRSSAAFPNDSTTQILTRLTSTGVPVTDALSGVTTPRIDVNAALSQTTIPVSSVSITPTTVTITKGNTKQLVVKATYSDNSQVVVTNAASYSSSDTSVVQVSSSGLLSAVGVGTATISATYGGKTGTSLFTANQASAVKPIVIGGTAHNAVLKGDGTLWAWGFNGNGELGDGTTTNKTIPVQVKGVGGVSFLSSVTSVVLGRTHSVALKSDGTVVAWGFNGNGQLGDGTTTERHTPVQVSGLTNITELARGRDFTIALKNDGTVWTWGFNGNGQLGDGTTTQRTTPIQVSNLTGVTAIAAGYYHSLALKSDGTVWSWGDNLNGQLGDGTTTERHTPVQVSGLSGVTAIAAGYYHSLALKSDGTLWAWGYNADGELGDGTTTDKSLPVAVNGLSSISTFLATGGYHSFALKSDGTVWAWGDNLNGQLGDGTTTNRTSPVQVSALNNVIALAGGAGHTVALKNDGTVWAWGFNGNGELGDGTTVNKSTPVQVKGVGGVGTLSAGRPTITSFTPTIATIGTSITITGAGFDATASNNTVSFSGGVTATPTSATSTSLTVTVPAGATTGTITVTTNGIISLASSSLSIRPSITSLSPTKGAVGSNITITGTGFSTTASNNTVTFTTSNGTTTATVTAATATSLTVTVPTGAITGNVTVTVGGNTSNAKTFILSLPPTLTALEPSTGAIYGTIIIKGTNFDLTPSNNTVRFAGGVTGVVTSATTTSLTVTVPTGAITGNITVTVGGNTSNTMKFTIVTDTTAPVTQASLSSGIYDTSKSVTLHCSDGVSGSGCSKTYYTTDGASPTTASTLYTGAITVSSTTTFKFFSVDSAGNSEVPKVQEYQIISGTPALQVSPSSLSFAGSDVQKTLSIGNSGSGQLFWHATTLNDWIILSRKGGIVKQGANFLKVSIDRSTLTTGNYKGNIRLVGKNGRGKFLGEANIPVSLVVDGSGILSVAPQELHFGDARTTAKLTVSNQGQSSMNWTLTQAISGLSADVTSGTAAPGSSSTVTLTFSRTGLTAGAVTGNITLSDGTNSVIIPVRAFVPATGTSFTSLSASTANMSADGTSTSTVTATFSGCASQTVSFFANLGSVTASSTSNASGVATVTYTAPSTEGIATVTAICNGVQGAGSINVSPVSFSVAETAISAPGVATVDKSLTTGLSLDKSGNGTPAITLGNYSTNPGTTVMFAPVGQYFDAHLSDTEGTDTVTIKKWVTASDITGLSTSQLKLYYFDGTDWIATSDSGYTAQVSGTYVGYIWANISSTSSPSITDLSGLPLVPLTTQATIPTLSEWGMMILGMLMTFTLLLRRKKMQKTALFFIVSALLFFSSVPSSFAFSEREQIAIVLQAKDTAQVPAIIALLQKSNDGYTRAYAAKALGELGDVSATAALQSALSDPDKGVQAEAKKALNLLSQ